METPTLGAIRPRGRRLQPLGAEGDDIGRAQGAQGAQGGGMAAASALPGPLPQVEVPPGDAGTGVHRPRPGRSTLQGLLARAGGTSPGPAAYGGDSRAVHMDQPAMPSQRPAGGAPTTDSAGPPPTHNVPPQPMRSSRKSLKNLHAAAAARSGAALGAQQDGASASTPTAGRGGRRLRLDKLTEMVDARNQQRSTQHDGAASTDTRGSSIRGLRLSKSKRDLLASRRPGGAGGGRAAGRHGVDKGEESADDDEDDDDDDIDDNDDDDDENDGYEYDEELAGRRHGGDADNAAGTGAGVGADAGSGDERERSQQRLKQSLSRAGALHVAVDPRDVIRSKHSRNAADKVDDDISNLMGYRNGVAQTGGFVQSSSGGDVTFVESKKTGAFVRVDKSTMEEINRDAKRDGDHGRGDGTSPELRHHLEESAQYVSDAAQDVSDLVTMFFLFTHGLAAGVAMLHLYIIDQRSTDLQFLGYYSVMADGARLFFYLAIMVAFVSVLVTIMREQTFPQLWAARSRAAKVRLVALLLMTFMGLVSTLAASRVADSMTYRFEDDKTWFTDADDLAKFKDDLDQWYSLSASRFTGIFFSWLLACMDFFQTISKQPTMQQLHNKRHR